MLSAKGLTCIRNERVLFENLSFQLAEGQLMYLSGENGAGKSSLMRCLAGLHQPQSGSIQLFKQDISQISEQILFIGHKAAINEWLSARLNLKYWLKLKQIQADEDLLLDKVGLLALADIPARYLSAGQKRRVALLRMWVDEAKLWLLDEPFTSIDVTGIAVLKQLFIRHKSNGGSLIVTSHQILPAELVDVRLDLEYRF